MRDLISRQAAIDAVNKICDRCGEHKKYDGVMCGTCYLDGVVDIIEDLPSAQPEPLTDQEQRIFLAAMEREEKIWEEIDRELRYYIEVHENGLVWACKEIVRKVNGALWKT